MKFLLSGIGSIGQRHARNLNALGHDIAFLRSGRPNTEHIQKFLQECKERGVPIQEYYSFDEAIESFDPDGVFITSPNSKHIDIALKAAKAGRHLFIEKPVSHNLEHLDELEELEKMNKLVIQIGYNLRWHPLLQKMREMIGNGVIGKVLSADIHMGEYVADWHPWEDYTKTYSVYQEGGGGALLCFSHDIDYLYWFFGMPKNVMAMGGQITPVQGDAEDMVKALLEMEGGEVVSLHLDYWQRPKRREFSVIGEEGGLFWNYETGELVHYSREGEEEVFRVDDSFDRNDTFIGETKDFCQAIEMGGSSKVTLKEGKDVVKIVESIKNCL